MRWRLLAGGLALLAGLTLGSCPQKDAGAARLRVVFWAGIEEQKIEQQNVDAFMQAHPGVDVRLESIPDNYLEKLVTAFAAHRPPDVLLLDSVLIPRFLDGGVLLDLQLYLADDPQYAQQFFPEVWQLAVREAGGTEQVYALPKDFTPLVVYYNKQVFDAAGAAYPRDGWSWDEFRTTAALLTSSAAGPGGVRERYGTSISSWVGSNIVWFWQAGGDVLSPDGRQAAGYLDSPQCIRALRFFCGLVRDGYAPDPTAAEALGGQAFMSGRIGMTISGHWAIPGFRAAAEENPQAISIDQVGVVGLPQDAQRASVIYESGWAVARESRQAELAVKLAQYLAGPEAQARRAQMGLAISANREVAARFAAGDPREQAFLDEVPWGRAPWGTRLSEWSVVETLLQEGIERVLLNRASEEESLRTTAQLIDAELHMYSEAAKSRP